MIRPAFPSRARGLRARLVRLALTGAFALVGVAATACNLDRALKVEDVDVATPEGVNSKAGLPVVYAGGRADFSYAVANVDAAVTLPGLLADELRDIDTFPTRIEVDQRNIQLTNTTVQTWYRDMHRARASLERAAAAYIEFDATNPKLAEMLALEGLMYVMFAEDFCNGVAYSKLVNGVPEFGAPMTGDASNQRAITLFDSALAVAPAASQERYLAQVGKGRALLNQGKFAEAAAAVSGVPVTFQYLSYYSENSGRENNGVYVNTGPVSKRFAVAEKDGGNGLPFRSLGWDQAKGTGDIRVRWYQSGVGQDGVSPAYYTLKYPSRSAPVVVADGIEAQLIVAETQLATNDAAGFMTTLNDLRANATNLGRVPYTQAGQSATTLAPLADPGTAAGRLDLLYSERAWWMYLTGHRLGDLRRLARVYKRPVESVFPTGAYTGAAGGSFGTDVNFPIPVDEQNNPQAKQCTDRNP